MRVAIAGAAGRMGRMLVEAVIESGDLSSERLLGDTGNVCLTVVVVDVVVDCGGDLCDSEAFTLLHSSTSSLVR